MQSKNRSTAGLIAEFLRGSMRYFAMVIIASTISIICNFLVPQIVGLTVDSVIGTKEAELPAFILSLLERMGGREYFRSHLFVCSAGVIVFAVLSAIFNYISRVNIAKGTGIFTKNMRDSLFCHTQHLGFEWHTKNQTGDIIQRCTSDVEVARDFVSKQLIEVLRTSILLITALIIMYGMNLPIALVVTVFIPIIFSYTYFFHRRISAQFRKADEAEGDLMIHVQENLTGVRVVRAFGREKYELSEFDKKNDFFTKSWIDLGYTSGLYWGLGDAVSYSMLLAVISVGSFLAAKGQLSLGTLLIFISYTQTITGPIRQMGRIFSNMSKANVSLQRIKEIMDAPAEAPEPGALTPAMDGDIVFDHVSFGYDEGHPVLKDLSFTVPAGSTLGILGATGSGKSTIAYLLNRLFELPPENGTITIGGVDIRSIDREHLRRNVGIVLQEPFLFSKSVKENIEIAVGESPLETIREKASIAAVDGDIMSLSEGYDTIVGERGVTLSGGQKQRVAIARTLMTGAPILVFDDSMSAVDTETDLQIRDALRTHTGGATVLLISHRISTLMHSDNILVLDDGGCAEFGTHKELLEKNGIYRRIYDIQSGYTGGDLR